jgi:uncharacterized membrane protein
MAFHDTLHARDRRLVLRLESLSDVVVGFAMSQLVIQLPQVGKALRPLDLFHILAYFVTFTVLVTLWLTFHRLMTSGFKPGRLDMFLAFVYLAFTSLMPYALNANFSVQARLGAAASAAEVSSVEAAWGIGLYAGCFLATLVTAATIFWRNLRRAWFDYDTEERDAVWQSFLRNASLTIVMLLVLIVDFAVRPQLAAVGFMGLFIPLAIIRRWFRKAPPPNRLGIPAPAAKG